MKSESATFQPQSIKKVPKRIVFQLDVSLDILHYCAWTDAINEERNCGTIRDFREALHHCKIIHPDDVDAYEQFIQSESSPLAVPKVELRLFTSSANYAWYRMYVVKPENQRTQTYTIFGVLELSQGMQGSVHSKYKRLNQDTLFRKAVTSSAILSLGFNYSTGERLISDHDVLPPWFPENIRLKDMVHILRKQVISPEKPCLFEDLLVSQNAFMDGHNQKPFYRDCRLSDLSKETGDLRWYRIHHSFIKETRTSPACFYLIIMDIHEDRKREQLFIENITYDQTTGMLRRCAFEHQMTEWLEHVRSEASFSYICSVVMVVDQAVEMITQFGREYVLKRVHTLGKTIKAFIHPQEICGRYGFARFAMVLSGISTEILQERLNMLGMICNSLNSEWPDLQVRFGSNLGLASQIEQGDVFLEKANQLLQREETETLHRITPFTQNGQAAVAYPGNAASNGCNSREELTVKVKHHIFIRTFGHFDVFVDGEAILFNHSKAKELLALLVDRRGGFVGSTEAISCLWEDEPANNTTLARCRKAAFHLRETLQKHGIEYLMETVNGKRRITSGNCDCDYYQYLQHVTDGSHQIPDSYLCEYSWAENTVAHEQ